MPAIIVVIVMLKVVSMAVIGLSTSAPLAGIYLDLSLDLYIVPPPVVIYPTLPASYRFYLDLDPSPSWP